MQLTPIFDQLVQEFAEKDVYILSLHEAAEPTVETPPEAGSKNTLYDATHLQVIRPAIPEVQKYTKPGPTFQESMQKIDDRIEQAEDDPRKAVRFTGLENEDDTQVVNIHVMTGENKPRGDRLDGEVGQRRRSVTERLQQADEELGIDNFDTVFAKAVEDLDAPRRIPAYLTPVQLQEFEKAGLEVVEQESPDPKQEPKFVIQRKGATYVGSDVEEGVRAVSALQKPSGFVRIDDTVTREEFQSLAQKAIDDGHVIPITKNVTPIKRQGGKLPKRRNKRGAANTVKQNPTPTQGLKSDTSSSPGSAA